MKISYSTGLLKRRDVIIAAATGALATGSIVTAQVFQNIDCTLIGVCTPEWTACPGP